MNEQPSPELSYEQARDELAEVVRGLEAGGATLQESLALWERGEQLAAICQQWLDGARQRLEQAMARTGRDGAAEPAADGASGSAQPAGPASDGDPAQPSTPANPTSTE